MQVRDTADSFRGHPGHDSDLIPAGIPSNSRPPAVGMRSLIIRAILAAEVSQEDWMATRRPKMRDVREVLRLHREGCVPLREVARMMGRARSTVRDMVVRFERSGVEWPVAAEISDAELAAHLYGTAGVKPDRRKQPEPDWSVVARELKRKHVTLQFLWEEYGVAHPDGYRYSRWCDLFRRWEGRLSLVMRQSHAARSCSSRVTSTPRQVLRTSSSPDVPAFASDADAQ